MKDVLRIIGRSAAGLYTDWRILVPLAVAAALANTMADQFISDWYAAAVKSGLTDDIADYFKMFGEHWQMAGVYAVVYGFGFAVKNRAMRAWGGYCLLAMLIGFAGLLAGQFLTGGSRPWEEAGSGWFPFRDDNGVSGHAWVGAVPFLAVARMAGSRGAAILLYGLSMMCGWSRINDEAHYLSQVLLGWSWAALSVSHAVKSALPGGAETADPPQE